MHVAIIYVYNQVKVVISDMYVNCDLFILLEVEMYNLTNLMLRSALLFLSLGWGGTDNRIS